MDEERIALRFEEGALRRGRSRKLFRKTFPQANLVRLHYHESLELNICRGLTDSASYGETPPSFLRSFFHSYQE